LCRRIRPSYSQIIQQATEFIKGNVRNKITIAQVARHVHVTSGWLSQLFRQELGATFLDYVTKLKMDEARVLLSRNMLVIETAAELGYQDSEYFAKVFKKHWGSSPAEFKKWTTGLSRR
jgi:YesN/AraC family two-component response regulator